MDWASRVKHPEERVGDVLLGKWRLEQLLGIGAMAAVFAAVHRNGKRVAIKLLHQHLAHEPVVVERFVREGYAANRVGHPAVVSALDDDVDEEGCPFLVMDLVEGLPLDLVLVRDGTVGWQRLLAIVDQVLDALAVAHDKGVLHRDLKPENLVLCDDGSVRILDFGIARVEADEPGTAPGKRLTVQGRAMGTPGFMAPEQAQGRWDRVDARSDLWSLGATMFVALTGREVHEATKAHEILLASMTKPVRPIQEVAPELPDSVAAIVDRALAFELGDRFPSARVMQEWVREALPAAPASLPEAPSGSSSPFSAPASVRPVASERGSSERRAEKRPARWGLRLLAAATLAGAAALGASALRDGRVARGLWTAPAELYATHFRAARLEPVLPESLPHDIEGALAALHR